MTAKRKKQWGSIYSLMFMEGSVGYSLKIHAMSPTDAKSKLKKRHPRATYIRITGSTPRYHE